MEANRCKIHTNKTLDSFCWNCQTMICKFCMQDHEQVQHKVYSLRSLSTRKKVKSGTVPLKSAPEEKSPEKIKPVSMPPLEDIKMAHPPAKRNDDILCIKCAKPVSKKDAQLKCQHWAHKECLHA